MQPVMCVEQQRIEVGSLPHAIDFGSANAGRLSDPRGLGLGTCISGKRVPSLSSTTATVLVRIDSGYWSSNRWAWYAVHSWELSSQLGRHGDEARILHAFHLGLACSKV